MSGALDSILCNREYARRLAMVPPIIVPGMPTVGIGQARLSLVNLHLSAQKYETTHTVVPPSDPLVSLSAQGCNKPLRPPVRALKSLPEMSVGLARSLRRAGFSVCSITPAFQPAQPRYL